MGHLLNSLEDQVIEIGRWDKALQTFAILQPSEASSANAVRVISWRRDVSLFFAPIMGRKFTDITRRAVAMVTPSCNGIWGMTDVSVPGTVMIDSYDSEEGAYVPGAGNSNGDVCSNGEITVSGTADIYGDVLSATGDVTINGGAATVSGVYEGAIDTVTAPSIEFPTDIATNNDNASIGLTDLGNDPLHDSNVSAPGSFDLFLNGETLTIAPGTYYFDDIIMTAGAELTLSGATTIYLLDTMWMTSNSVLNTTMNPANLTIFCSGEDGTSTIHLSGGAAFYGAIMAPNSDIELRGNSDYYGALVGDTIDFGGNFQFHVDESLELINTLKGPVVLVQ